MLGNFKKGAVMVTCFLVCDGVVSEEGTAHNLSLTPMGRL